jgi:F-type H+-transporting ATPase subunit epsilon
MAGEHTYPFEILTLQRAFLRETVTSVTAPGQEGVFQILANHAPFVFALKPGLLKLKKSDAGESRIAVGAGFLIVQKDRTTVLTRSAERPEEIDVARAERAKERALKRIHNPAADIDLVRAQAALQRALARLKVAEYATA